jgi:hypothetical protein
MMQLQQALGFPPWHLLDGTDVTLLHNGPGAGLADNTVANSFPSRPGRSTTGSRDTSLSPIAYADTFRSRRAPLCVRVTRAG